MNYKKTRPLKMAKS